MKAIVKCKEGPGNIALMDMPIPSPGYGEVLIKVRATSICGTDVHINKGDYKTSIPIIIGHEFSGDIVQLGDGVTQWSVGDRVVAENINAACGTCEICRTGNSYICPSKRAYGTDSHGAMAEYFSCTSKALHRIPDSVSFEDASVVEPLAVVNHAILERCHFTPEGNVVVLGSGPIGLLAVQVCRSMGSRNIILCGTGKDVRERFPLGKQFGATHLVNVERENVQTVVANLTGGVGADYVIEASGSILAAQEAIRLVGRKKSVIVIGLMGRPVTFDWDSAVFKEIDLNFSKSSSYLSWHRALSMMASGRVDVGSLITHRMDMTEWEQGMRLVEKGEAVKVILYPA